MAVVREAQRTALTFLKSSKKNRMIAIIHLIELVLIEKVVRNLCRDKLYLLMDQK